MDLRESSFPIYFLKYLQVLYKIIMYKTNYVMFPQNIKIAFLDLESWVFRLWQFQQTYFKIMENSDERHLALFYYQLDL